MKKLISSITAITLFFAFTCTSFGMMKSTGIVKQGPDAVKKDAATDKTKTDKMNKDATKGKKIEKKQELNKK